MPNRRTRGLRAVCLVALTLVAGRAGVAPNEAPKPLSASSPAFVLETLVDFPDDAGASRTFIPADIDAMMGELARLGIKRVSWAYYADGRGGFLTPSGYVVPNDPYPTQWQVLNDSYRNLVNPLKVAVEAGHRHGLEVYVHFKPYETGVADTVFPEGSPAGFQWGLLHRIGSKLSWMDPFVWNNPQLRIQRRTDDAAAKTSTAAIRSIRLTKKDDSPTRITADNLQIWTSPDNFKYRPIKADFVLRQSVEPAAHDFRDHLGKVLTRRGQPTRVLTLSGLNLEDKYVLVTTAVKGGKPDFVNSGLSMMTALDGEGREIPGVIATSSGTRFDSLRTVNFKEGGLMYDCGWGRLEIALDADNTDGKQGFVAFSRGRDAYIAGTLCETEPEVQKFWLRCLEEIIAAGVDGVDFRYTTHGVSTDHPEDYGFNPVVLEKARARPGDLLPNIAAVRGEAFTEFLRLCRKRLNEAGIAMRFNLDFDLLRPDVPEDRRLSFSANINFDWPRWIEEGLLDGTILRFHTPPFTAVLDDRVATEIVNLSRKKGIPVTVNRYVQQAGENLTSEVQRVKADGRFAGFVFYETGDYMRFKPDTGEIYYIYPPVLKALAEMTKPN